MAFLLQHWTETSQVQFKNDWRPCWKLSSREVRINRRHNPTDGLLIWPESVAKALLFSACLPLTPSGPHVSQAFSPVTPLEFSALAFDIPTGSCALKRLSQLVFLDTVPTVTCLSGFSWMSCPPLCCYPVLGVAEPSFSYTFIWSTFTVDSCTLFLGLVHYMCVHGPECGPLASAALLAPAACHPLIDVSRLTWDNNFS